jgi:glutamate-5-semialdehyde dehydrogenase
VKASTQQAGRIVAAARAASRALARATTAQKNAALDAMADALRRDARSILRANAADVTAGRRAGLSAPMLDRLTLDEAGLRAIGTSLRAVADLPDPVREVVGSWKRPNGLEVMKVRIPLGVILVIYESRPNVTVDAAALCLKSGNAVILRGGREALRSNLALGQALARGIEKAGIPQSAIQVVGSADRRLMLDLLKRDGEIDLAIPRGGEPLIRFVAEHARVPVVRHYKGVCHVYVDRAADPAMAASVVVNAKAQRPGVCNAAECLLVDRAVAAAQLPELGRALADAGIELRACPASYAILRRAGVAVRRAEAEDFGREFLDRIIAVRVVRGVDGALEHIARYGSLHTEAIVTEDPAVARRFAEEVDASAVMVNASTRFNDGFELGLGAEIGISTTKLHAFGPMGLAELTAQKYVVLGRGQVR